MLSIGLAGENPFEGSPNDVPISNIARGITIDILQIFDEDPANIPEQFENKNDIHMYYNWMSDSGLNCNSKVYQQRTNCKLYLELIDCY